jgi:hypothetical protein
MGIIKTAATVAVASSVHGRVQRRQQQRWAAQDQAEQAATPLTAAAPGQAPVAQAPPAASLSTTERISALKQLAELRDSGVLSEFEFETEKRKILNA